jgi:hypothetical protein
MSMMETELITNQVHGDGLTCLAFSQDGVLVHKSLCFQMLTLPSFQTRFHWRRRLHCSDLEGRGRLWAGTCYRY